MIGPGGNLYDSILGEVQHRHGPKLDPYALAEPHHPAVAPEGPPGIHHSGLCQRCRVAVTARDLDHPARLRWHQDLPGDI
eukprot:scaffold441770_cov46-Prasinocladus_malaysianus.AAC.5